MSAPFEVNGRHVAHVPLEELDNSSDGPDDSAPVPVDVEHPATVVTSLVEPPFFTAVDNNWHLPVLDIDFPARLIPSSTPDHYHLYLDGCAPLAHDDYMRLLEALERCGIISAGYLHHSKRRGFTTARHPDVRPKRRHPEQEHT